MAEVASSSVTSEPQSINPFQLSVEQLNGLKTELEAEIGELQKQLESLAVAKNRFTNAKATLQELSASGGGTRLLVPLNSSLYVPGRVTDPNKVRKLKS